MCFVCKTADETGLLSILLKKLRVGFKKNTLTHRLKERDRERRDGGR